MKQAIRMIGLIYISGFCHSPVDIRASARAGVCARERKCVGVSVDRSRSVRENRQESDKNHISIRSLFL